MKKQIVHEIGYFTGYTNKKGKLILQYADNEFSFSALLMESRGHDVLIYRERIIGGFRDTVSTANALDFLSTLSPQSN